MTLWGRSDLSPVLDIGGANAFYYLVLGVLLSALLLGRRIVGSRFGRVIRGIRENERRMQSLGFPTFRYKLACFVMAGAVAGLAGVLLANLSLYVSPSTLHWTRSGEILIMVILGGMGTLVGPVLGAATLLVAEEVLSNLTRHWMLFLGPLLILLVLFGEGGMVRWLRPGDDR
jgi:branched-chain amino acid transport system permease protein